jgi:hypothetical protein
MSICCQCQVHMGVAERQTAHTKRMYICMYMHIDTDTALLLQDITSAII